MYDEGKMIERSKGKKEKKRLVTSHTPQCPGVHFSFCNTLFLCWLAPGNGDDLLIPLEDKGSWNYCTVYFLMEMYIDLL